MLKNSHRFKFGLFYSLSLPFFCLPMGHMRLLDKVRIGLMFADRLHHPWTVQLDGAKLAIKEINAAGGVKFGDKRVPIETFVKTTSPNLTSLSDASGKWSVKTRCMSLSARHLHRYRRHSTKR